MFSLWRPLCLYAITSRGPPIPRVTHPIVAPVSLWALRRNFKSHVTIQQRPSSSGVKYVRREGFRTHDGIFVTTGDTVELRNGNFLRVKEVLQNGTQNVYSIVGWRFVRNAETLGLPGDDLNEVFWVVHLVKNDPRPMAEKELVEVDSSQIQRKRMMTMVNTTYQKRTEAELEAHGDGALFCRWKHITITKTKTLVRPWDAFHIHAFNISEASHQRLRYEECDDGHNNRTADETLRRSWRGVTMRRDESKEPTSLLSAVEALSLDDKSQNECLPPAYTFADVCCGAGGASGGAELAGLRLCWALDNWDSACRTYHLYFPHVRLYQKQIQDFIHMLPESLKVDIMHLSLPCQPFSPANRHLNPKKDAEIIAANMEIGNCLDIARPRIATLEQTSGLMSMGYVGGINSKHWDNIIKLFTSRGYSVSWKIINFAELGLPQARKRLIIIASW